MPTLIIAATTPGAGKTALTAALASHLSRDKRQVMAAQAWGGADDPDAGVLTSLLGEAGRPAVASPDASPAEVAAALAKAAAGSSLAVVEGKTGGHEDNLALAEASDGMVVLAARFGDDILSAASAYGSRLVGVVVNAVPRYRQHELESTVIPSLDQADIKMLGWIPEDRRLLAPTAAQVADHLGAELILNEESSGRLVDNFLIGGMILDWGPTYFRSQKNVGVIVRGDRPDIQLAALQSDTMQMMVLTGGARPVEYVVYEAGQREVPVALTSAGTAETADSLGDLLPKIRFDHPDKLTRMLELARDRLDLDAVENAMALPSTR